MSDEDPSALRAVSYGGGVQSTALLVLAAQGRIDFQTFVMANVGEDSEDPRTLEYFHEHAAPYAAANGIDLHLVDKIEHGEPQTLWERMAPDEEWAADTGKLREPIPIRGMNGKPFKRSCTSEFKIRVTGKWLRARGATAGKRCLAHKREDGTADIGPRPDCAKCVQERLATVAIGISLDEIERANTWHAEPYERIVYPLIGVGDDTGLHLRRSDCGQIIRDAGLPIPPKSSCFFCPFHSMSEWTRQRNERPELFAKSVRLEDRLNARRRAVGKDPVYLTRFGRPLVEVVPTGVESLPFFDGGDGECDSGWCMT